MIHILLYKIIHFVVLIQMNGKVGLEAYLSAVGIHIVGITFFTPRNINKITSRCFQG